MVVNVLIAGAGQLGARYLQGLALFSESINIWVYDISIDSLNRARERWDELPQQPHAVAYIKDFSQIPAKLDAAFVTTNADVRLDVVKKIVHVAVVRYWVLEKVLVQRIPDLQALKSAIGVCEGAWVNTPMYLWPLYHALRARSDVSEPIEASFTGTRGVACNAIHYIDFVSRWGGSRISSIDTVGLNTSWTPSKRDGFMELEGNMVVYFTGGSRLLIAGDEHANNYKVTIKTLQETWEVDESSSRAISSNNNIIQACILRQSELTGPLLKDILENGRCDLPSLDESIKQHEPLLHAFLAHWNSKMSPKLDYVPIT
jgi:hypothetical protein